MTNISNDLVKIEFRSNTHLVLNTLPGVNWLGRQFFLIFLIDFFKTGILQLHQVKANTKKESIQQ